MSAVPPTGWQWLRRFDRTVIDGEFHTVTGEEETLLIVLSGTFDMSAGGGQWLARGMRSSPFDGRPVALFLPPRTRVELSAGRGEVLFVAARQPAVPPPPPGAATSTRPLLPLAGSGKAYDPAAGVWRREEDFPSAPEAILPRRIETLTPAAGVELRRVFPREYKALTLCLDELVLAAGAAFDLPGAPSAADYPDEIAVLYETTGELLVGDRSYTGCGLIPVVATPTRLIAGDAAAYLAIALAGNKVAPATARSPGLG